MIEAGIETKAKGAPVDEDERPPLPIRIAIADVGRCFAKSFELLARRRIRQPGKNVGLVLTFGDGSHGRVYRETVAASGASEPVALVVEFRLRWIRGWGHRLFRAESLLNTPLFVGFPGFASKLWVANDERGFYRGIYEWNGSRLAHAYARALWWVLALVSERSSIHYHVVSRCRRDDLVAATPPADGAWWRIVAAEPAS
jgi:hypothetical protein